MSALRSLLPAMCVVLAACSGGASVAGVPCFYYQNPDGTKTAKCGDASSSTSAASTFSAAASRVALDVPHRQFKISGTRPYVIVDTARPRQMRPRMTTRGAGTRLAGAQGAASSASSRRSFRVLARAVEPASASSSSRPSSTTSRSTSTPDDEETILDRMRSRRSSSSSSSSRSSSVIARSGGTGGTLSFSGEHCPRNRSLIGAVFSDEEATCGADGWTFPVLMNGDCPISACILKVQDSETFGSMNF